MPPAKRSPSKSSPARSSAAKPAAARSSASKSSTPRSSRSASSGARAASPGDSPAREDSFTNPRDLLLLTRDRIQEALDDAAARGRMTRKDANDLLAELVRRGRAHGDELMSDLESLVNRGRTELETAARRARRVQPVDRVVRGADRARRAAGVGPSFPISGYDELNANQARAAIRDLSKPELRRVLAYERKHADRKTVVGALEKALAR